MCFLEPEMQLCSGVANSARVQPWRPDESTAWYAFFTPDTPVVALPDWDHPRLLVDAGSLTRRWRGSGFYPAFRRAARSYRLLLRLKVVSGMGSIRRAGTRPAQAALADYLADVMPQASVRAVILGVGNRAGRYTAQLVARDGSIAGYLKCAATRMARGRLRNEHALLYVLPSGAGPQPLKFATLDGMDAMLMAPVRGRSPRASLPPPQHLLSYVRSLATSAHLPLYLHPWLAEREIAAEAALRPAITALSAREWPVVRQHGDLAPWNLVASPSGRLTAIDWEYGLREGFPGLDLAQYILQVAGLIHRWSPGKARVYATRYLLDSGIVQTIDEAAAIVGLAAYAAFQNTLLDGHPADDPLQRWRRSVWREGRQ